MKITIGEEPLAKHRPKMYLSNFLLQVPVAPKELSSPLENHNLTLLDTKFQQLGRPKKNYQHTLRFPCRKSHRIFVSNSNGTSIDGVEPRNLPLCVQPELLPKHVAITIDGHRRWALNRGLPSHMGYKLSRQKVKMIINLCADLRIEILNIFLFTVNNWLRPKADVDSALSAFEKIIELDYEEYSRRGIKLSIIGEKSRLPASMQKVITSAEEATKQNTGLHVLLGLNYSGRQDITLAIKSIAKKVSQGLVSPDDVDQKLIGEELDINRLVKLPDPDLLIRATGDERISDFCLWNLAHTELYFARKTFPDFEEEDFFNAILWFQGRKNNSVNF